MNFVPGSGNPFSHFLFPLTNWLVNPLRKIIPFSSRFDICPLLASYVLILVKVLILVALSNDEYVDLHLPLIALFNLIDLALSGLIGLVLVYALFTWTGTNSPTQELFYKMTEPLLSPIRKFSPRVAGIDSSALILIVLIQMTSIILRHAQKIILSSI
jgi:YggT family protein